MNDAARTAEPAAGDSLSEGTRVFKGSVFRVRDGRAWTFTEEPPPRARPRIRRAARVAGVLAQVYRLEAATAAGEYGDRADAARQLGFTSARITQILDLLVLAPDIQERILDLEVVDGVEPISERSVRTNAWAEQRRSWAPAKPKPSV